MATAALRNGWSEGARRRALVGVWVLAVLIGLGLVMYGFGPVLESRSQTKLARVERAEISRAANGGGGGLSDGTGTRRAPTPGAPVGILEIGSIRLQQVVVEGGASPTTQAGPGHVSGTAGLGQPGNSVVVGRARAFGGPFGSAGRLHKGASVLVTTAQGQSVYVVDSVRHVSIRGRDSADGGSAPTSGRGASLDSVYGPSDGDRLTLVTSGSPLPWNASRAIVIVATMQGKPFAPTPQNGRLDRGLGGDGDGSAAAAVVLAMVAFGAALSTSVFLYRRLRPVTAYILSIGPVMATAVMAAETVSRLFPGWT